MLGRGSSLAVQQMVRVVTVSVLAAVIFLLGQFWWLQHDAERSFASLRDATASSMRLGLSTALWNLDDAMGGAIVEDAFHAKPLRSIVVVDTTGRVFVSRMRSEPEPDLTWWERLLDGGLRSVSEHSLPLRQPRSKADPGVETPLIGQALLRYDTSLFVRSISGPLADQTLSLLFIILTVAAATSLVMHVFLVRHIVAVVRAVEQVAPDDPAARPLRVPRVHQRNEFGRMARRFNTLLLRLAEVQQALRRLATRDALTDLPNRSLILEILDQAITDPVRPGAFAAVMLLDLDLFKHINDSLGHEAGDEVLKEVGRRLSLAMELQGAVGRLGGDEFVLVLKSCERIEDLARVARRVIEAVKAPVDLAGTLIHPSTSIGIACHPADGPDAETLLRNADTALYAAKAAGPGQWAFFDRSMTENALTRLHTESSLRKAVENGDFLLHFQPKVDLATGRVSGCEALVRWRLNGDLVAPGRFIPIAEETGLICDIGLWVLREACHCQVRWAETVGALSMAVNVSARQLREPAFLEAFLGVVATTGIDLEHLELEITESDIMSQFEVSAQLLANLKGRGVRLAVDDFGTGYSSLAYLKNLPLDVLKIDRSFVNDLPGETSIPRMIIGLSGHLGLRTVAEGIETPAQFTWLRDNGCHQIQGHWVSPPLEEEAFLTFCRTWDGRHFASAAE
ncbi:putative bifunctional diguanylate cyclase/phosphodiesterase [Pararhodospirillum photometricum]|uniref:Diguanylate cyclase/phosphodiesterase n=1 Tax=Pararhodospirillum photometricum DSM 122 TaxID=1150469 RepID=H6SLB8_PARPM|nr:EAL domain-containing protein [Pararhodospirillum photometricum]CCG08783.1 Diguanylate cyclase/phosphodiesterase [Pararhodospirillum photometricum DSM 122]